MTANGVAIEAFTNTTEPGDIAFLMKTTREDAFEVAALLGWTIARWDDEEQTLRLLVPHATEHSLRKRGWLEVAVWLSEADPSKTRVVRFLAQTGFAAL